MAAEEWFYVENDEQRGPVSLAELRALLGSLPPDTRVWREGMPSWLSASLVPELSRGGRPLPPPLHPPRPPGPAYGAEYDGYNPLEILRLAFKWGGTFDRGQFAIAYFGGIALFYGLIFGIGALAAVVGGSVGAKNEVVPIVVGALMVGLVGVMLVMQVGAVVRRLRDAGQHPALALALVVPCVNLLMVIYLLAVPGAAAGASSGGSGMPIWAVVAVAAFLMIPMVGIIAAIAIPSLLRARVSANESATIGDLRSIVSAQAAYQASNRGFYESKPGCLATPASCIPGYTGPPFLDLATFAEQKSGYRRQMRTGSTPGEATDASPTSTNSFAVEALPVTPNTTGVRGFCVDHTGVVCSVASAQGVGSLIEDSGGEVQCSSQCLPLR
jgi:type IV pilus assembly protein PilA